MIFVLLFLYLIAKLESNKKYGEKREGMKMMLRVFKHVPWLKSTHQCVWKQIFVIITTQHVAAISLHEPVKNTNLGAVANTLLLAWWCLSNTSELHLITVVQTHLQSPEEGCNVNNIHLILYCFLTVLMCSRVELLSKFSVAIIIFLSSLFFWNVYFWICNHDFDNSLYWHVWAGR